MNEMFFPFKIDYFKFWFLFLNDLRISAAVSLREFSKFNILQARKTTIYWSDKGLKSTVLNLIFLSVYWSDKGLKSSVVNLIFPSVYWSDKGLKSTVVNLIFLSVYWSDKG